MSSEETKSNANEGGVSEGPPKAEETTSQVSAKEPAEPTPPASSLSSNTAPRSTVLVPSHPPRPTLLPAQKQLTAGEAAAASTKAREAEKAEGVVANPLVVSNDTQTGIGSSTATTTKITAQSSQPPRPATAAAGTTKLNRVVGKAILVPSHQPQPQLLPAPRPAAPHARNNKPFPIPSKFSAGPQATGVPNTSTMPPHHPPYPMAFAPGIPYPIVVPPTHHTDAVQTKPHTNTAQAALAAAATTSTTTSTTTIPPTPETALTPIAAPPVGNKTSQPPVTANRPLVPTRADVLFPITLPQHQLWPGNVTLDSCIFRKRDEYAKADNRREQSKILSGLLEDLHKRGGRVLTLQSTRQTAYGPPSPVWRLTHDSESLLFIAKGMLRITAHSSSSSTTAAANSKQQKTVVGSSVTISEPSNISNAMMTNKPKVDDDDDDDGNRSKKTIADATGKVTVAAATEDAVGTTTTTTTPLQEGKTMQNDGRKRNQSVTADSTDGVGGASSKIPGQRTKLTDMERWAVSQFMGRPLPAPTENAVVGTTTTTPPPAPAVPPPTTMSKNKNSKQPVITKPIRSKTKSTKKRKIILPTKVFRKPSGRKPPLVMDEPVLETLEDVMIMYSTPVFSHAFCRKRNKRFDETGTPLSSSSAAAAAAAAKGATAGSNSKASSSSNNNNKSKSHKTSKKKVIKAGKTTAKKKPPLSSSSSSSKTTKNKPSTKKSTSSVKAPSAASTTKKSSARSASTTTKRPSTTARRSGSFLPRGVTMRPSGKWQAQVYFRGASRYIGVFNDQQHAVYAFDTFKKYTAPFKENSYSKVEIARFIDDARKAATNAVLEKFGREAKI